MVRRLPGSWSHWNLVMLVFEEGAGGGKELEYPEKNLLEQGREPMKNSTHIMVLIMGLEPRPHWLGSVSNYYIKTSLSQVEET